MKTANFSLDFLTFFQELIDLDFDEKTALDSIYTIHKPFQAECNYIYKQLDSGASFFQIFNTTFSPFWELNCTISSLNLSQWLNYKINYIKETKEFYKFIKTILAGPALLFGLSLVLNLYLAIFFIPKITLLLSEFNTPIPNWITLIETSIRYINLYFIPFFLIIGMIGFLLKRFIKKLIYRLTTPIAKELFVIDLFSMITPYLNQGVDIKSIIKQISISNQSHLNPILEKFKTSLLNSSNYITSFSILISNSTYVQIIIQAIATNKLEFGLTKIVSLYRTRHKMKLKKLSLHVKSCATILTGINILIGFYLTILPMNQIITTLITPK